MKKFAFLFLGAFMVAGGLLSSCQKKEPKGVCHPCHPCHMKQPHHQQQQKEAPSHPCSPCKKY